MNQKVKNRVIAGAIAVTAVIGGVKFAPEPASAITPEIQAQATADFDRIRAYDSYCLTSGTGYISNVTEYQAFVEEIMADPERKQGLKALMDLTDVSLDTIRARHEAFKSARDAMLSHKAEFQDHLTAITVGVEEEIPPEGN